MTYFQSYFSGKLLVDLSSEGVSSPWNPPLKWDHSPSEVRFAVWMHLVRRRGSFAQFVWRNLNHRTKRQGSTKINMGNSRNFWVKVEREIHFPVGVLLISDYLDFASIDSILNVPYVWVLELLTILELFFLTIYIKFNLWTPHFPLLSPCPAIVLANTRAFAVCRVAICCTRVALRPIWIIKPPRLLRRDLGWGFVGFETMGEGKLLVVVVGGGGGCCCCCCCCWKSSVQMGL